MADNPLEGEILPSANADVSPPRLKGTTPSNGRNINVSRRVQELGVPLVDLLSAIALGDNEYLGTDEEIRVFERRAAITELLSYVAPKMKAKEHVDTEEEVKPILTYVPKRGEQKRLETLGEIENNVNDS